MTIASPFMNPSIAGRGMSRTSRAAAGRSRLQQPGEQHAHEQHLERAASANAERPVVARGSAATTAIAPAAEIMPGAPKSVRPSTSVE